MLLSELLKGIRVLSATADGNTEITGVSFDSRRTEPGHLFTAIPGFAADGHRFIPAAVERGAAAVLCERVPEQNVPYVQVEDARAALAAVGANLYGHPAEHMTVVGVTGTNGKTSTTYLLKHVLERCRGAKVGLIGTIRNMIGDEAIETERTTPESLELQALFAEMLRKGCTHVVMEVSSHALALHRVDCIPFEVGVFTNLTEDHLDFHKTMEAYRKAKALLFSRCRFGVFNVDDAQVLRTAQEAPCEVFTVAERRAADLRAEHVLLGADSVRFDAVTKDGATPVKLGIPGAFTVYNAMSVLGAAIGLGISPAEAAAALESAEPVKGRLEVVPTPGRDYTVLIDYAHTPDALENTLRSVRGFCKGRLIAVFGCGGDRDPIKRPIMGRIGVELADLAIVTSDNPRTEDPHKIIADILEGVKGLEKPYLVEENRRKAIRLAMGLARRDDVIVLCGKGHETYQILGTEKTHLDEREEVAAALEGN